MEEVMENEPVGFKENLLKCLQIEKEIELIQYKCDAKICEVLEAKKVMEWLECKNFIYDNNLKNYISSTNNELTELRNLLAEKRKLFESNYNKVGPFNNLRNVVWCIAKELAVSLEQLADKLECPKDTFTNLCEHGKINRDCYMRFCNYFGLDKYSEKYSRYISKGV